MARLSAVLNPKFRLGNSGFSLIEVMIAAGLVSAGALMMAGIYKQFGVEQKENTVRMAEGQILTHIESVLANTQILKDTAQYAAHSSIPKNVLLYQCLFTGCNKAAAMATVNIPLYVVRGQTGNPNVLLQTGTYDDGLNSCTPPDPNCRWTINATYAPVFPSTNTHFIQGMGAYVSGDLAASIAVNITATYTPPPPATPGKSINYRISVAREKFLPKETEDIHTNLQCAPGTDSPVGVTANGALLCDKDFKKGEACYYNSTQTVYGAVGGLDDGSANPANYGKIICKCIKPNILGPNGREIVAVGKNCMGPKGLWSPLSDCCAEAPPPAQFANWNPCAGATWGVGGSCFTNAVIKGNLSLATQTIINTLTNPSLSTLLLGGLLGGGK